MDSIKKNFRVYPLGKQAGAPKMNFVNGSGKEANTIHANNFKFYEEIDRKVQDEPSSGIDMETLGLLASIGIVKDKPFAPDARMKKILTEAVAVGNATARAITFDSRIPEAYFYPNSAWCTPFIGGSAEFQQNGARACSTRAPVHREFESTIGGDLLRSVYEAASAVK